MNSFVSLNEKKFPAMKCFHSSTKDGKIGDDGKISNGQISLKDYLMCEKIWDKFDIKDMDDCHNHYLKKDVLLLADVFKEFIDPCMKFYRLDPCHYFSSPELECHVKNDWDRIGKNIRNDMYLFIEKELGGGVSYISKR